MASRKPILCLDFDGVIHSYSSGWQGHSIVSDAPVPGFLEFAQEALAHFRVMIYSSRSLNESGISAMRQWIEKWAKQGPNFSGKEWWLELEWPQYKPSAFVTIDDRALTFTGIWPAMEQLLSFKPWHEALRDKR